MGSSTVLRGAYVRAADDDAADAELVLSPPDRVRAEQRAVDAAYAGEFGALWGACDLEVVSELDVMEEIGRKTGLPSLDARQLATMDPDGQAYEQIGDFEHLWLGHILPFRMVNETIEVVLVDPSFPWAVGVLQDLSGSPSDWRAGPKVVTVYLAPRSTVRQMLQQIRGERGGTIIDTSRALEHLDQGGRRLAALDPGAAATSSEIVRSVDAIIEKAVALRASDIHLDTTADGLTIRVRVDGRLQPMDRISAQTSGDTASAQRVSRAIFGRLFHMAEQGKENVQHRPIDGRIRWTSPRGQLWDIRMSAVGTAQPDGIGMVLRLLASGGGVETLDNRGFEPRMREDIGVALKSQSGIVVLTGPVGSGKSTTLHAMVGELATRERLVITIEDPVERKVPALRQIEVKTATNGSRSPMDYAGLLRTALRQDPDVIMCGEIRDSESAHGAMQMSNTGRLVLTTLHTNTALLAVKRLADLGASPFSIANEVRLLVAQRLTQRLCRRCHRESIPADRAIVRDVLKSYRYSPELTWAEAGLTAEDLQGALVQVPERRQTQLRLEIPPLDQPVADYRGLRQPGRCGECDVSPGYRGRLGLFSQIRFGRELRDAVLDNKRFEEMEEIAYRTGARSLLANGLLHVLRGETSVGKVLATVGPDQHATSL